MANSAFSQSQSPYASETTAGLVEEATQVQADAGTDVGETGAKLFVPPSKILQMIPEPTVTLPVVEDMDGTTTPVAVAPVIEGGVIKADADGAAAGQKFLGFTKENKLGHSAEFLSVPSTTIAATVSLTIPAGTNVMLFVYVTKYVSSSSMPSGYTFNGIPMTSAAAANQVSTYAFGQLYWVALGNLASPLTADLVRSGGANLSGQLAIAYQKVHQTTPIVSANGTSGNPVSPNPGLTVTGDGSYQTVSVCWYGGNTLTFTNPSMTFRGNSGGTPTGASVYEFKAVGNQSISSTASGSVGFIAFVLKKAGSPSNSTVIQYGGVVTGFTGLVPGAPYYVSNTPGAISTTPGTTVIPVGVAETATTLLVQSKL